MDYSDLTEADRVLLSRIHYSRKKGYPELPNIREEVGHLIERGWIVEDDRGLAVSDDLLMTIWAAGRPL